MAKSNLKIYQIYFSPEQKEFLSPAFTPLLNEANDEYYEFGVFKRSFESGLTAQSEATGFVSWKFETKTYLEPIDLIDLVQEHPGYDTWFINPFPELEKLYRNVWAQGVAMHPGLRDLCRSLFQYVGYKADPLEMNQPLGTMAYCNYFVGTQGFWKTYMDYCLPIFELLRNPASPFYAHARESAQYHGGAPLIPFVTERLYSTLLATHPGIRAKAFDWSEARMAMTMHRMRHDVNRLRAKKDVNNVNRK
jgi:hypothetical protein